MEDTKDREEQLKMVEVECKLSVQCEDTELHGRGSQSVACSCKVVKLRDIGPVSFIRAMDHEKPAPDNRYLDI